MKPFVQISCKQIRLPKGQENGFVQFKELRCYNGRSKKRFVMRLQKGSFILLR